MGAHPVLPYGVHPKPKNTKATLEHFILEKKGWQKIGERSVYSRSAFTRSSSCEPGVANCPDPMLFVRCAPLPGNTQTVGSDSTKVSCQRKPMEDLSPISFQPEAENRTAHTFVVNSCMQTLVRDVNWRRRITTAYVRGSSRNRQHRK